MGGVGATAATRAGPSLVRRPRPVPCGPGSASVGPRLESQARGTGTGRRRGLWLGRARAGVDSAAMSAAAEVEPGEKNKGVSQAEAAESLRAITETP